METYSREIKNQFKASKRQNVDRGKSPNVERTYEEIRGCSASFRTKGKYLAACIMDYWRFETDFPKAAREEVRGFGIEHRWA